MPISICPNCHCEIENRGFKRHKKACLEKPSANQLLDEYYRQGYSQPQMAKRHNVSRATIFRWLVQAGHIAKRHMTAGYVAFELIYYPELSPHYEKGMVCKICPDVLICQALLFTPAWLLCEAADQIELDQCLQFNFHPGQIAPQLAGINLRNARARDSAGRLVKA